MILLRSFDAWFLWHSWVRQCETFTWRAEPAVNSSHTHTHNNQTSEHIQNTTTAKHKKNKTSAKSLGVTCTENCCFRVIVTCVTAAQASSGRRRVSLLSKHTHRRCSTAKAPTLQTVQISKKCKKSHTASCFTMSGRSRNAEFRHLRAKRHIWAGGSS